MELRINGRPQALPSGWEDESLLIALIGSVVGWLLAHTAILLASPYIEEYTGVWAGFLTVSAYEFFVLPLVLLLAILS